MSYTIKNPDKVIKKGNLTRYEDMEDTILPNLKCPFCNAVLKDSITEVQVGQNRFKTKFRLGCSKCYFAFEGMNERSEFRSFVAFYEFAEEKLEALKNK